MTDCDLSQNYYQDIFDLRANETLAPFEMPVFMQNPEIISEDELRSIVPERTITKLKTLTSECIRNNQITTTKQIRPLVNLLKKESFFSEKIKGDFENKKKQRWAKVAMCVSLLGSLATRQAIYDITNLRAIDLAIVFPMGIPGVDLMVFPRQFTNTEWTVVLGDKVKDVLDQKRQNWVNGTITKEEIREHVIFKIRPKTRYPKTKYGELIEPFLPQQPNRLMPQELNNFTKHVLLAIWSFIYLFGPTSLREIAEFCECTRDTFNEALEALYKKLPEGVLDPSKNLIPGNYEETAEQRFYYAYNQIFEYIAQSDQPPFLEEICQKFNVSPYYVQNAISGVCDPEELKCEAVGSRPIIEKTEMVREVSNIGLNQMIQILDSHGVNVSNGLVCEGGCNVKSNRFYTIESVLEVDHIFGHDFNDKKHLRVLCGNCHAQTLNISLAKGFLNQRPNYVSTPDLVKTISYSQTNMLPFGTEKNDVPISQQTFTKERMLLANLLSGRRYEYLQCENCDCDIWRGNSILSALEIHHKDGCHDNNDPMNLRVYCRNCHNAQHFVCNSYFDKKDKKYKVLKGLTSADKIVTTIRDVLPVRLMEAVLSSPGCPETVAGCARLLGLEEQRVSRIGNTYFSTHPLFATTSIKNQNLKRSDDSRLRYPLGLTFNDLVLKTEQEIIEKVIKAPEVLQAKEERKQYLQELQDSIAQTYDNNPIEY